MNQFKLTLCLFCAAICFFSSCKKITEDNLINGLWLLKEVNIDTSTVNYLTTLPHYSSADDCCQYKMDFEKDGTMVTYYLTHDTLSAVQGGMWYVTQYKQVFIQVDNFIDGVFDIEQTTIKKRTLTSEQNHIEANEIVNPLLDTAYTKLLLEKI